MKIQYKISLQFSLIVAFILLVFSSIIYFENTTERKTIFYDRLTRRAETIAERLSDAQDFSPEMMQRLENTSMNHLYGEQKFVFDDSGKLVYTTVGTIPSFLDEKFLTRIKEHKTVKMSLGNRQITGQYLDAGNKKITVIESAIDIVGHTRISKLLETLVTGFFATIIFVVAIGIFFAKEALSPIQSINQQIAHITAENLRKRVRYKDNKDEINELVHNFNSMLSKLEVAFDDQKKFVSHASHELRTPLSAMKSEIQLALEGTQNTAEYKEVLNNLLRDTERLTGLSQALLQLARPYEDQQYIKKEIIHIEEVLFEAWKELGQYQNLVSINFANVPQEGDETQVLGNATLLQILFVNLIENAIKYSNQSKVQVEISFTKDEVCVQVIDQGIGISEAELQQIFTPFFRGERAMQNKGFGIGLSVSEKIVKYHNGRMTVNSAVGKGSTFLVAFPRATF